MIARNDLINVLIQILVQLFDHVALGKEGGDAVVAVHDLRNEDGHRGGKQRLDHRKGEDDGKHPFEILQPPSFCGKAQDLVFDKVQNGAEQVGDGNAV